MENKDAVWAMLEDGAVIYVCGDAGKMAPDVRKTFAKVYQAQMGKSEVEAEQWLAELERHQRYLVDVWASA
jgi:cytochrome P450/NADPH-cytochrome P450 reductase